ncbi:hypothetical protein GCM10012275_54870 [Longimycelium tulufanense]|uniref:Uncharacterized protein n=1 Tax=Longimycelium tulufanense TaxID=907463 RepID=A0A8J3FX74_9PSEU|nr:hypothetical protein [Longimycelium tulufanense]GGM77256.1 hypothetical protein GCM10012275_54870 [Longimycelium tulufanense]
MADVLVKYAANALGALARRGQAEYQPDTLREVATQVERIIWTLRYIPAAVGKRLEQQAPTPDQAISAQEALRALHGHLDRAPPAARDVVNAIAKLSSDDETAPQ